MGFAYVRDGWINRIFIGMLQRWVTRTCSLIKDLTRFQPPGKSHLCERLYGLFLTFARFLLFAKEKDKVWKWISA